MVLPPANPIPPMSTSPPPTTAASIQRRRPFGVTPGEALADGVVPSSAPIGAVAAALGASGAPGETGFAEAPVAGGSGEPCGGSGVGPAVGLVVGSGWLVW